MIRDLPHCISALSNKELDKLEKILSNQYFKVCKFYKVIRNNTSSIKKIKYDYKEADTMLIDIFILPEYDLNSIYNDMLKSIEKNDYDNIKIDINIGKHLLNISINEKE